MLMSLRDPARAGEQVVIAPAGSLLSEREAAASRFGLIVAETGHVRAVPGPVFSEGNDEGMVLPSLLSDPRSVLVPEELLNQGWEGPFILAVEVLPDGGVGRSQIMQSTGSPPLDRAMSEIIQSWKFHPATQDGKPVVSCIQIPVEFQ